MGRVRYSYDLYLVGIALSRSIAQFVIINDVEESPKARLQIAAAASEAVESTVPSGLVEIFKIDSA